MNHAKIGRNYQRRGCYQNGKRPCPCQKNRPSVNMKAVFGQDKHTLKAKEHHQFKGGEWAKRHQGHPGVQCAANEKSAKNSKVWMVLTRERQKEEPVEPALTAWFQRFPQKSCKLRAAIGVSWIGRMTAPDAKKATAVAPGCSRDCLLLARLIYSHRRAIG